MSRSYRKYKFRCPGKRILNEIYEGFEASNRMSNKTLCYNLMMGKTEDYFTHYKKKYWSPFNIWCCFCEYPKGFHGNGFEMYDAILNESDATPLSCLDTGDSYCIPSDWEISEAIKMLSPDEKAYFIRRKHYLYKK